MRWINWIFWHVSESLKYSPLECPGKVGRELSGPGALQEIRPSIWSLSLSLPLGVWTGLMLFQWAEHKSVSLGLISRRLDEISLCPNSKQERSASRNSDFCVWATLSLSPLHSALESVGFVLGSEFRTCRQILNFHWGHLDGSALHDNDSVELHAFRG